MQYFIEVHLQSIGVANSIYNMEWQMLDNKSKKELLLIMKRSMMPIEFNSAVIITLNLESFVSVSINHLRKYVTLSYKCLSNIKCIEKIFIVT